MDTTAKAIILAIWSVMVFVLISMPMPEINPVEQFTYYDKIIHALLFGVFSFLLVYLLADFKDFSNISILFIAFIAGVTYSAAGEFIQIYVPGRTVSEYDFLAGLLGVFISLIFSYEILKQRKT